MFVDFKFEQGKTTSNQVYFLNTIQILYVCACRPQRLGDSGMYTDNNVHPVTTYTHVDSTKMDVKYVQLIVIITGSTYSLDKGKQNTSVLHFINSLQSANALISQTAKRYQYYMTKILEKSFCYINHVVQVNSKHR